MGSRTYDFLADSLLFDETLLAESFASLSDDEIKREVRRYREFAYQEAPTVEAEISRQSSSLVVLSDEPLELPHLVQSALYVNQYVFDDPLLSLAERLDRSADAMNQYLGMRRDEAVNRRDLADTAKLLKSLTPFVAGNFLKLLPCVTGMKAPQELKINYSPTAYDDALPTEIMKLFREAAIVKSMTKVERGFRIESSLEPGRAISVRFRDHPDGGNLMYLLWEQHISEMNEETHTYQAELSLPAEPPHHTYFQHWVKHSINQAALTLFTGVEKRLQMAGRLNAVVGSRSELMFRAIQKTFKPNSSSVQSHTANTLLNLELPFLTDLNPEVIMRIRQEEGEAFQRFRLLLDQKLSTIREKDDPEEARRNAVIAVHELTQVRMDEIDGKLKGVKEKFATNAVLAGLGLATAVQTSGIGLLSTAYAATQIANSYFAYRQDVKRNPAFFLWKLLRTKK